MSLRRGSACSRRDRRGRQSASSASPMAPTVPLKEARRLGGGATGAHRAAPRLRTSTSMPCDRHASKSRSSRTANIRSRGRRARPVEGHARRSHSRARPGARGEPVEVGHEPRGESAGTWRRTSGAGVCTRADGAAAPAAGRAARPARPCAVALRAPRRAPRPPRWHPPLPRAATGGRPPRAPPAVPGRVFTQRSTPAAQARATSAVLASTIGRPSCAGCCAHTPRSYASSVTPILRRRRPRPRPVPGASAQGLLAPLPPGPRTPSRPLRRRRCLPSWRFPFPLGPPAGSAAASSTRRRAASSHARPVDGRAAAGRRRVDRALPTPYASLERAARVAGARRSAAAAAGVTREAGRGSTFHLPRSVSPGDHCRGCGRPHRGCGPYGDSRERPHASSPSLSPWPSPRP